MKKCIFPLLVLFSLDSQARIILSEPGCFSVKGHYLGFSEAQSVATLGVLTGSRSEHKVRIQMKEDPGILRGVKVEAYLSAQKAGDPDKMRFQASRENLKVLEPSTNIILNTWTRYRDRSKCAQR